MMGGLLGYNDVWPSQGYYVYVFNLARLFHACFLYFFDDMTFVPISRISCKSLVNHY